MNGDLVFRPEEVLFCGCCVLVAFLLSVFQEKHATSEEVAVRVRSRVISLPMSEILSLWLA